MNYKVHTIGAVASSCGVIYLSNQLGIQSNPMFLISGAIIGGLIPDIDHPKSFLGNIVQPISIIIRETLGHRTLTHSILFALIVSTITAFINIPFAIGLGVGIFSHIILDLLTPHTNGVAFLYPLYKKKINLF